MASHIELNPATHITVGAVGEPGQREFFIQGSRNDQVVSLLIEKEQANILSSSLEALLKDLEEKHPTSGQRTDETIWTDMTLKEPVESLFRVGNMGLGFNEDTNQIVLVAYELVDEGEDPNVVSYWITREQARLLIPHTQKTVRSGRFSDPGSQVSPKMNGHVS